jgi:hypothetical protein
MRTSRRGIAAVAVAAVCLVGTTSCSAYGKCKPLQRATPKPEAATFYRHANEGAVYRVGAKTYCLVADQVQMAAFGGFAQVKVVAPSVDFMRGKSPVEGMTCRLPQ